MCVCVNFGIQNSTIFTVEDLQVADDIRLVVYILRGFKAHFCLENKRKLPPPYSRG